MSWRAASYIDEIAANRAVADGSTAAGAPGPSSPSAALSAGLGPGAVESAAATGAGSELASTAVSTLPSVAAAVALGAGLSLRAPHAPASSASTIVVRIVMAIGKRPYPSAYCAGVIGILARCEP